MPDTVNSLTAINTTCFFYSHSSHLSQVSPLGWRRKMETQNHTNHRDWLHFFHLMPERIKPFGRCWDWTRAACVASDRVIHYSMPLGLSTQHDKKIPHIVEMKNFFYKSEHSFYYRYCFLCYFKGIGCSSTTVDHQPRDQEAVGQIL